MSDREELREALFESILSPYAAGSDLGLRDRDECDADHAEIEGHLDIGNLAGDLLAAGYRPPARVITTREELDEVIQRAFEDRHWLVVQSGVRPWIIVEDEDGDAWAWSWLEEDETQSYIAAESFALPVTVLHEGEA